MAHELININSPWATNADAVKAVRVFADDHLNFLTHVWDRTPVYLVDPQTMDEVYPPERRVLLNEECVRRVLGDPENETAFYPEDHLERTCDLLRRLMECCSKTQVVEFWGVYLHRPIALLPDPTMRFPCVVICPEKILEVADDLVSHTSGKTIKASTAFRILFAKVLFHELGHAFMAEAGPSKKPAGEFWARVVEESLANALAWGRFNPTERWLVNRVISGQPVEYRGYTFWQEFSGVAVREIARSWSAFEAHPPLLDVLFARMAALRRARDRARTTDRLAEAYLDEDHPEKFWGEVALRILEEVLR